MKLTYGIIAVMLVIFLLIVFTFILVKNVVQFNTCSKLCEGFGWKINETGCFCNSESSEVKPNSWDG